MFLWSIRTGAPLKWTLKDTCRSNNNCFPDVGCQTRQFGRIGIIVCGFVIVLPVIAIVVADRIDVGVASGSAGIVRRAIMSVWTNIKCESQFVQVGCLEEPLNKFLDPMEWSHRVCGKTTCSTMEIVREAVFASIYAWCRCAHRAQSIGGWSFKTNNFKHQRLSNLQILPQPFVLRLRDHEVLWEYPCRMITYSSRCPGALWCGRSARIVSQTIVVILKHRRESSLFGRGRIPWRCRWSRGKCTIHQPRTLPCVDNGWLTFNYRRHASSIFPHIPENGRRNVIVLIWCIFNVSHLNMRMPEGVPDIEFECIIPLGTYSDSHEPSPYEIQFAECTYSLAICIYDWYG